MTTNTRHGSGCTVTQTIMNEKQAAVIMEALKRGYRVELMLDKTGKLIIRAVTRKEIKT